ncbi:MAG TPA: cytoplasmic protein [Balneola sp.]|jgi:hypothetical protein|nr:cytoplasmic protein [Balneola sp.]MAO77328.1 cytoplasmic protein [Balneola sp.]HAH50431.1 cytoplasmic protein [Balneola sp.]HAW81928.1 cytoplasmic protein [Balneola sp.]HBZ39575.1 cytoplasmic protein [Balneola sp.]|tara:strand:+ start:6105 stop:6377 length:273 start_codon:yes stop_codon:yes gene_type:complete
MRDYIRAHIYSSHHREKLLQSNLCGCFYCLATYSPNEIEDWVDERKDSVEIENSGQTALCPKCGIDSVIGDKSGYPIEKKFLKKMNKHWF